MLHNGVHFPDWETHLQGMIDEYPKVNGKATYQWRKLKECLALVDSAEYLKKKGNAVDVGAHVGLWSMHLVDYFEHVYAFEPVLEYRQLYHKNVYGDYTMHSCACGDDLKMASMQHTEGLSGHTMISEGNDIEVVRIDDCNLENISFMKFDCEGYEYFSVKGAEKTIKEYKPVIIVEQKPGYAQEYDLKETQAVDLLKSWGAKLRKVDCGDYILSWD